MKTTSIKESMGILIKEETLQTVDHYIMQNTLVLESLEPFPGYHGDNAPGVSKPDSLFLITDKLYPVEDIYRISQNLCTYQHMHLDACPVDIFIFNTYLNGIRIKGLTSYAMISELQGCYIDKGVHFMKGKNMNAPGLIRINKVFELENMEENIYKDLDDDLTSYISLPYHFNWNLFKTVTLNVKNNLDNSNFDCALGFIYLKTIMEFVRIYGKNIDTMRLQQIRNKYLEEIRKIQEDMN
jgi:hypothetical protein